MIVVDASLALKLVLNEPDSGVARRLWQEWSNSGEARLAPPLFRAEIFSVLRRNVHQGQVAESDADLAYEVLENLVVQIHEPAGLYRSAWEFASRFNRPTVYDCCYLALAAIFGCDFWTADRRLINALGGRLPWVRTLT